MAEIQNINDSDFEQEVLQADVPVVVDFWAEWCGPCHVMEPVLADLATEFDGTLKFVKIDTEQNFQAMERYGVRGLPTLMVFTNGERARELTGGRSKSEIKKFLESELA